MNFITYFLAIDSLGLHMFTPVVQQVGASRRVPRFQGCDFVASARKMTECQRIYPGPRTHADTKCTRLQRYLRCLPEIKRLCDAMSSTVDPMIAAGKGDFQQNCSSDAVTSTQTITTARARPLYRVTSKLVEPWVMMKRNYGLPLEKVTKDHLKGHIIDLLDAIAEEAKFDYELHLQNEGLYGSKQRDGQWNGMIGELVRDKADIAAAPITVTINREQAVDFTVPCHKSEACALMNIGLKINNMADLVDRKTIRLGTVMNGPVYDELRLMQNSSEAIWAKIMKNPGVLKNDTYDCMKEAKSGCDYVFIVDGMTKDWIMRQEPCQFQVIKTGFYKREHAFAVRNYSPLRDIINRAMTNLHYNGKLQKLEKKWASKHVCSNRKTSDVTCNSTSSLGGAIHAILGSLLTFLIACSM